MTRIHRIAAVGNSAVLIFLLLIAASEDRLFSHRAPAGDALHGSSLRRSAVRPAQRADRLVLVVIDGLRADTAADANLMPALNGLGRLGGRSTAHVESVVPSSIAGIISLCSGEVPPPASFLSDFQASPREDGGIFEAVARSGGRSFVAGPTLWLDLYGRWIAGTEPDPTFGHADGRLLAAALQAIRLEKYQFIVLHLGRTDAAAHEHGTQSPEYRAAARWCDGAVERISRAMGPQAALLVTSDHGNTDAGGHAGPEPSVLATPIATFGPGLPRGDFPDMPQRTVPALILAALGIDGASGVAAPRKHAERAVWTFVPIAFALACGLLLWSGLHGTVSGSRQAFALNLTVWLMIALLIPGLFRVAIVVGLAVLAGTAMSLARGAAFPLVAVAISGAVLGVLRLADGFFALDRAASTPAVLPLGIAAIAASAAPRLAAHFTREEAPRQHLSLSHGELLSVLCGAVAAAVLGGTQLALVFLAAILLGRASAKLLPPAGSKMPMLAPAKGPIAAGLLTPTLLVLLGRALGETTSLSTIDVRTAFKVVEWPFGLPLAVITVMAAQALPALGLLLGMRSALARLAVDSTTWFAAGLAATLTGQAIVAVLLQNTSQNQTMIALGLGLFLRAFAETLYVFLTLALLLLLAVRTQADPPPAIQLRTNG